MYSLNAVKSIIYMYLLGKILSQVVASIKPYK